jgi:hypothetical protein
MVDRTHRRRSLVLRAACCEALERRTLLSLAGAGMRFRSNTQSLQDHAAPAAADDDLLPQIMS